MGKGGCAVDINDPASDDRLPIICWDDIKQHSSSDSCWIVVRNKVRMLMICHLRHLQPINACTLTKTPERRSTTLHTLLQSTLGAKRSLRMRVATPLTFSQRSIRAAPGPCCASTTSEKQRYAKLCLHSMKYVNTSMHERSRARHAVWLPTCAAAVGRGIFTSSWHPVGYATNAHCTSHSE
jgi:hypothetical protein